MDGIKLVDRYGSTVTVCAEEKADKLRKAGFKDAPKPRAARRRKPKAEEEQEN